MPGKTTSNRKLPLTPSVEEGPYYKTGSPERAALREKDTPGIKLAVEGQVLDQNGRPIPHAWLDFWQADGNGRYDNTGYKLRGHQFTDKDGRYRLETVRPHEYSFRSPHIHAKVRATESSPVLTIQLYFPGEKRNATDPLFENRAVLDIKDTRDGQKAHFDFVIKV
jgi:protocatechuate 3,4-dioxygenase beta subunit